MKTALKRYNKFIEVIHPVSLLARQLVCVNQPLQSAKQNSRECYAPP
jgi:hypothetical protein